MTSVTQTFGPRVTRSLIRAALEKNFTSSNFVPVRGGTLSAAHADKSSKDREIQDRLLHRRKGLSGSEFAGIGIQFAFTLVLFAFAGIWLDRRLGTSPWLVIVMVFAGATLGFWALIRKAR